ITTVSTCSTRGLWKRGPAETRRERGVRVRRIRTDADGTRPRGPRRLLARMKPATLLLVLLALAGWPRASRAQFHTDSEIHPSFWVYHDPDGDVSVKEFALFRNIVAHTDTISLGDSRSEERRV